MSRSNWVAAAAVAAAVLAVCLPARAATEYPLPPSTTTTVDGSAGDQTDPHVSGSLVSYTDFSSGGGVIHYRDLVTGISGSVPSAGAGTDSLSAVSGQTIAYVHFGDGSHSIYTYQPGADAPVALDPQPSTNRREAAIGGNTVAWQDFGFSSVSSPEIVAYDRTTGVGTRLTNDSLYDRDPAVSPDGSVITWAKCATVAGGCDVWDATLADGVWTVHQLTGAGAEETLPHTDGTVVVYGSDRGGDSDIRWQPVAGGTEQTLVFPGLDQNAHIATIGDDEVVTFEHYRTEDPTQNFEIYAYDLTTEALYRVTTTPEDDTLSDVAMDPDGTVHVVFSRDEAAGDDNVYATTFVSAAVSHTVLTSKDRTVDTLTAVQLRAAVTSSGGPTGDVQFAADGVALGTPVPLTGGVARLTTMLPAGHPQVTAAYLGNGPIHPSQSAPLAFTIRRIASTTVLEATDRSIASQGLTAHVTTPAGQPDGSVQFLVGSNPLGAPVALDANGAAVSTTPLPSGQRQLSARYLGDGTYLPSTSGTLQFVVPRMTNTVHYGPVRSDFSVFVSIAVRLAAVSGHPAPRGRVDADNGFTCKPLAVGSTASTTTCHLIVPQNTAETVTLHYGGNATYAATDGTADVSVGGW